ncbi:rab11 family-interacting protein 3 isoform X1 [Labeo rohita]|uniref:rab11 family-interacting protein 3 isoform X1 n=1 Tax=Labeo rohita TaxID=84645 RepID=UPI0021E2240B|nr:rab11 family-interacting protein 3 isoform X1 [Labeo rohita]
MGLNKDISFGAYAGRGHQLLLNSRTLLSCGIITKDWNFWNISNRRRRELFFSMEQVLSSPQGCSEWEVSGKAEWESEQDPLGFLLMDKDNSSVGDSTNEIFQENAINLDDLFWSSQYSGQTYSWENGLECVYPEWKAQPGPSQNLKGEGSPGNLEIVDGDLICFNSRSTSPTFSNVQSQNQNTFYNPPEQVPDFLQPMEVTATSNPLDVYTGELGIIQSDKTLLQESHLLEDTHLTNCEFSHSSLEERTFVNNDSQSFHLSLESEGLLPVSPVELSCTDTNSNPKPSIISQFTPEHIYLPTSALPCEPIPPTTCTEPTVSSFHEGSAPLPMDELEMLLPGLLDGGLHSASNETHDDDLQTQETTNANMETTQLSSEVETVYRTPLGESCISSEVCEESLCDLSTECTFDVPLEMVGEEFEEEVMSNATTANVFSEAETGLALFDIVDLQVEDLSAESLLDKDEHKESTSPLPVSTSEHNALIDLSPEDDILTEDHSQSTPSTKADALFEVPRDGDIPDSTFEILTDSVSCEAVPSLDSENPPVTVQVKCDANSPDLESNSLTLEFQDRAEALFEVPHDGDIPDSILEILTDSTSCEALPSLDSVIPPVTEQDKCDANSPDLESSSLTLDFQYKADSIFEVPQDGDIPNSTLEILTDSVSCKTVPSLLDSLILSVTEQDKCDANLPDLESNSFTLEAFSEAPHDGDIPDSTFEILTDSVSCEAEPSLLDSLILYVTEQDKCDVNSTGLESNSLTIEIQDKADFLFEVPHDGDIPNSTLEILTDSVSCEAEPSLLDSLIPPVTEQDKCDANPPDLESSSLTIEIQDKADSLFEVPHNEDIPNSTLEILTDSVSCEAVPSLLDSLILYVTEQDKCDVNSTGLESNSLTIEIQDKADSLFEVPHDGDIPNSTLEILTDSVSCEAEPSLLDSLIPPVTEQDKCDANSPDYESSSLTLEVLSEAPHDGDFPDSSLEILTDSVSCEAVPSLLDSLIPPVTEQDKCDANSPDHESNSLTLEALSEAPHDGDIPNSTFEILIDSVSCEAEPSLLDSLIPPVTEQDKCDVNLTGLESSSLTLEFQDKAEALFEASHDGDIPNSTFEILTDSVSCEAVPSLLDSLIPPVTELDKCDANSPDHESSSLEVLSEAPHDEDIPDSTFEILTDSISCEAVPSLDSVISPVTEQDQCDANSPDLESDSVTLEALFEAPHYGDIPDSTLEILTDSIFCEAVPSLDSVISPVTEQDECDANSPDLESSALTLEFQDNVTNVETHNLDTDPEAVERQRADDTPTTGNTEDSDIIEILESLNLHQNQEATNLDISSLNLENSKPDNQELNAMSETCQEQVNMLVEDLTPLDQPNDSLTANSSTTVIDKPAENVTAHNDSHNAPPNVEEKLHSVSLQGGERSDYSMSTQNQVIPHCESNPDSLESTPFNCTGDQLTVTGGEVGPDLTETTETPGQLHEAMGEGEGEAGFPAQEDFHELTLSQKDLAQEQQVSSVAPSSPPSHRNVFPCGASLDGEAYLTLMENNPDTPNIPKHAEMTLDLCKASDALPTKSLHDQRVPVDLINVPIAHKSEEQSALRAVFQALDQDGDGFVHIEEFVEFAKAYGAEQVKDLTRFLDPSGLGVISFEDFHRGISAISNEGSDPDLYKTHLSAVEANGPPEEYDEQAEVSDSAYLGSESAYSECETFTDEDTTALVHPELHEDVETDSGIENTLTDGDDRNRFTLGSDLNGHTLVAVIGGEEEHFEDFGESNNTSDLLLANQEDGGAGPEGEGDAEPLPHPDSPLPRPLMLLSPSPSSFPASFQSFLQSEALEFFCTHCHKQISRLEDLSTRLQMLEMNSSSKRMSSKKAARHLQQSGTLDVMGDLTQDILDLADRDITDKVLLLEKRVCELEKDSLESEEQHARLRQENLTLVHRANALEEQLKEQELHAEENLLAHTRKHRDALNKLQRERDLEIENLQARLHQLDEENSELRSCVPCLRANIERLEEEKRKLQDEVDDVSDRLNEEIESRRKMSDKLSHERHTNQKEKECTQGLIEDLRKQLEHLQLFKLETEARRGRSASSGLQEYNTHMRENELEQEIRRLKQDNRSLKEQNDELNGQIINLSIQGAKSLFTESLSESLAAEINNVSRAELMEAIHKQEEINFRLQDYIDRIIVAIMESNPSILEVK